jgi:hypothetical protein
MNVDDNLQLASIKLHLTALMPEGHTLYGIVGNDGSMYKLALSKNANLPYYRFAQANVIVDIYKQKYLKHRYRTEKSDKVHDEVISLFLATRLYRFNATKNLMGENPMEEIDPYNLDLKFASKIEY